MTVNNEQHSKTWKKCLWTSVMWTSERISGCIATTVVIVDGRSLAYRTYLLHRTPFTVRKSRGKSFKENYRYKEA